MGCFEARIRKKIDALREKLGGLEAHLKDVAAKQDKTEKAILKAQAVRTALVLIRGILGGLLMKAFQVKAFWNSL